MSFVISWNRSIVFTPNSLKASHKKNRWIVVFCGRIFRTASIENEKRGKERETKEECDDECPSARFSNSRFPTQENTTARVDRIDRKMRRRHEFHSAKPLYSSSDSHLGNARALKPETPCGICISTPPQVDCLSIVSRYVTVAHNAPYGRARRWWSVLAHSPRKEQIKMNETRKKGHRVDPQPKSN